MCACVFVVGRGYTVFMLSVHLFAHPLLFGAFFFSELFFFRREGHFFWLPITFFGWENKNKSECFVFLYNLALAHLTDILMSTKLPLLLGLIIS